jgi:DNA-binding MarR family transcriptional regulator
MGLPRDVDDNGASPSADSDVRHDAIRIALWHHRYRRWAETFISRHGASGDLTLDQLWTLYLIRTQGLNSAELARHMLVSPTAITGMVNRLVKQGLVQRIQDEGDRRRYHLLVTAKGSTLSDGTVGLFSEALASAFRLDESEMLDRYRDAMALLDDALTILESDVQ